MSLEQLQSDYKANSEVIKKLDNLTSTSDLVNLIKYTIWPFQENILREMDEMDVQLQQMVDGLDDVLCEETAGIIAAPIVAAKAIIARFKAMLPQTAVDELLAIKRWEKMVKDAEETLADIVVMDADDGEDEGEGDEDEGDDDDEGDEDEDDKDDNKGAK